MGAANPETVRRWREKNASRFADGQRRWKAENRDRVNATQRRYEARHREKRSAHNAVYRALKRGDLTRPDACEGCGRSCKPQAHHDDYTKPLDVRWLCPTCHGSEHKEH